jgi:hypothetical protein
MSGFKDEGKLPRTSGQDPAQSGQPGKEPPASENRATRDDASVPARAQGDPNVGVAPHGEGLAHEERDMGVRVLAFGGIVIAGLMVIGMVIVAILTGVFGRNTPGERTGSPFTAQTPVPQAVELRAQPVPQMQRYRATAEAELNASGWVDQGKGVVRIPITRAMELVIEGKLPALAAPTGTPAPTPASGG